MRSRHSPEKVLTPYYRPIHFYYSLHRVTSQHLPINQNHNDKELLLLVAEGDEHAFARFFRQWSPLLQHWIHRLVKDDNSRLEALQDVFIQIWTYRDKLPEVANITAWLKTVTTHQCFRHLARQKAWYAQMTPQTAEAAGYPSPEPGADHHLNFKEIQAVIQQALATLSPQQRQIYRLSREEGLNSDQIARKLDLSRGHVRNTISAVLAHIRAYLLQAGKIFWLAWILF